MIEVAYAAVNQKSIWKFSLVGPAGHFDVSETVKMPKGARIIDIADQYGRVCIWAIVDPNILEQEERKFRVLGTGWNFEELTGDEGPQKKFDYLGTAICGSFVWHVFEEKEVFVLSDFTSPSVRLL